MSNQTQSRTRPTWEVEHPGALNDIDASFLAQFIDKSWKNDAMPTFHFSLTQNKHLLLCLDYQDAAMRDFSGGGRFRAYICEDCKTDDLYVDVEPEIETDDFEQFKAFCNANILVK